MSAAVNASRPTDTAWLHCDELSKRFGSAAALEKFTLSLSAGEIFALLGPSGCGKTTLLRVLAGLITPDAGRVLWQGSEITRLSPEQRGFGFVFQSMALFPHLNVWKNIAFGLHRLSGAEQRSRIERLLTMTRLEGLERRLPAQLSGGQQQRVALARALALQPKLLFLDEPFASLDSELKGQMRKEIREIVRAAGCTAILVTHDLEDAYALADRIGVMRCGKLLQAGTAEALYRTPTNAFVARFLGPCSILEVHPVAGVPHRLQTIFGQIQLPANQTPRDGLLVRPENVHLNESGKCRGIVKAIEHRGSHLSVCVEVQAEQLLLHAPPEVSIKIGSALGFDLDPQGLVWLDRET